MDREPPKTRTETKKSGKGKDKSKTIYSSKRVRALEAIHEKKGK